VLELDVARPCHSRPAFGEKKLPFYLDFSLSSL
jgi:hypothetical protein